MPANPRLASLLAALLVSALLPQACGRTEPLRYRAAPEDAGDVGDAGDAGPDAALVCADRVLGLKRALPEVMLVLDRSTSMNKSFSGGTTRWEAVTRALSKALPPVDRTMELGALLYPDGTGESCTVAVQTDLFPALGGAQRILDRMSSTRPGGHTPTAVAVDAAAIVAQSTRAASSARALLLATDGAPNCNAELNPSSCTCASGNRCNQSILCLDDERTIGVITTHAAAGLPTYVVGIQDSSSDLVEVLDRMAVAGGRPLTGGARSYYAASSEAELEQAFVSIRNQVGSCTWLSAWVPDEDGSVEIKVDGLVVPFDPDAKDGWTWSNRANGELTLYGSACLRAAQSEDPVVEGRVLCPSPDAGP